MPTLPDELFSLVEKAVLAAREAAEVAAQAALNTLAVNRPAPYDSMSEGARQLRRALRAKARQLGGGSQTQGLQPLVEEIAYQHWHRMLFARFLAENDLLMHPSSVPVTLQDCAELAPEEGEADAWAVAARYASEMLPGIFRRSDPVVGLRFAPEGRLELERILAEMPAVVFQADDSLGWMYQFWQSKKKDEVNASERKIGGADLAPVTQLFTEDYMVRFLLENSLGAWWAARHPDSPLIQEWEYLRFKEDGEPAAGTFSGWPEHIAEVTVMDPCCGSGHFWVAAFGMMYRMRMEAEGLGEAEAADAVIRDNLFALEIDPRCTQIAAFALALAAWKAGGFRELPAPNIACSGIPVQGGLDSWLKLAGDDDQLRHALTRLYQLFENATTLGSLINPADVPDQEKMFSADFFRVAPIMEKALRNDETREDISSRMFGQVASDTSRAAKLLSYTYTLVITNVPYLKKGNQSNVLQNFCEDNFPDGKSDLATAFVERCRKFTTSYGVYALVTPQNWLSLGSYESLRLKMLMQQSWHYVCWMGPGAFRKISGEVVKPSLLIFSNSAPSTDQIITGIDATNEPSPENKADALRRKPLKYVTQKKQLSNPDSRLILSSIENNRLLNEYAYSYKGVTSGDDLHFKRCFWELPIINSDWQLIQSTVNETTLYGGCQYILWFNAMLYPRKAGVYIRGENTWGKKGVAVSQMGNFPCSLSLGRPFDTNTAVILPNNPSLLACIWAFCSSPQYSLAVRRIDKSLKVTNATLAKIPFDLEYWKSISEDLDPLPDPFSNNLTQWLFKGHPVGSTDPLHVAVARLLGYRWPEQESNGLEANADEDGIVCLTPAFGEAPAADRLRALLQAAYGQAWSAQKQAELLAKVGFTGKSLRAWLRDGFFKQHVKLFKNRPFIWHIWDGRGDGFQALVNYHRLDAANLERLIYSYLGDWIRLQRDKRDLGEPGADGRLVAALGLQEKLEAIREGEAYPKDAPPNQRQGYDIYVRWKSLAEQPLGWNPDLNDGVRLNIRPFVTAGVLRSKFTIHWKKDRGKNPDGSERHNDLHYTIAEKKAARQNL